MSKIFQTATFMAALLSSVSGHTAVEKFEAGGKTYEGFRQASLQDPGNQSPAWWTNQGWGYQPIYGDQINHPDIIAHKDAKPSPYSAKVPAGSDVTFTWHHVGQCGEGEEGWDCSHHGWTATYLAPCHDDCSNVDKTSLEFFKIHESALIDYRSGRFGNGGGKEAVGFWGTDSIFYENGNKQTVKIPKDIPSGNYVLRTEVMSVHNNGDVSQRQFWPQAFNIDVTGGDASAQMPAGKKATELYSADDELLKWNLYWHAASKTFANVPGIQLASVASAITSKKARSHARDFS